jgi:hypothetical protein
MPSFDEHLSKARKNQEFAASLRLDTPTCVGWALTALFYSALHYVEAYNAKYHHHCDNHKQRNDEIVRNDVLVPIWADYSDLANFSWNARYRPKSYGVEDFNEAQQYQANIARRVTELIAN